jgi:hypothetical protein
MTAEHVMENGTHCDPDEFAYWDENVTIEVDMEPNFLDYAEPYPGESFYTLKLRNTNLLGPTGMYLLPSMNPWICTVNSWYIEVEGLKLKINEPVEIKVEVTSKIDGGFIGIILCEPGVTKSFDVISGPSDFGKYIIKDDIKSGWVKTYTNYSI